MLEDPIPLRDIQRHMAFIGWQGEPATGFQWKRDADGREIARAHDATWHADVAEAEAFCRRVKCAEGKERRRAYG